MLPTISNSQQSFSGLAHQHELLQEFLILLPISCLNAWAGTWGIQRVHWVHLQPGGLLKRNRFQVLSRSIQDRDPQNDPIEIYDLKSTTACGSLTQPKELLDWSCLAKCHFFHRKTWGKTATQLKVRFRRISWDQYKLQNCVHIYIIYIHWLFIDWLIHLFNYLYRNDASLRNKGLISWHFSASNFKDCDSKPSSASALSFVQVTLC